MLEHAVQNHEQLEFLMRGYSGLLAGLTEAWLFGSRANQAARDDSDWDVLLFADEPAYITLSRKLNLIPLNVDVLIVLNGDDFFSPRIDDGKRKHGSLSGWNWKALPDGTATYTAAWWSQEKNEVMTAQRQAIRVWSKTAA